MRPVLVAVAIVVLLTGCGTPDTLPLPSPTATAEVTAEPSTTPTPDPTKPAISELVVSPEGLGPLVIGEAPPVTSPALDILVFDPDGCYFALEGDPTIPDRPDYGVWISNYGHDPATNTPGPFGVLMQEDGSVGTIGIYDASIKTATGVHLGMTREELLAAYPAGLELETLGYGVDNYRLRGISGDLVFSLWESETGPFTVNQMNVSHPGHEVPMGGSDYGYWGVCYGA